MYFDFILSILFGILAICALVCVIILIFLCIFDFLVSIVCWIFSFFHIWKYYHPNIDDFNDILDYVIWKSKIEIVAEFQKIKKRRICDCYVDSFLNELVEYEFAEKSIRRNGITQEEIFRKKDDGNDWPIKRIKRVRKKVEKSRTILEGLPA